MRLRSVLCSNCWWGRPAVRPADRAFICHKTSLAYIGGDKEISWWPCPKKGFVVVVVLRPEALDGDGCVIDYGKSLRWQVLWQPPHQLIRVLRQSPLICPGAAWKLAGKLSSLRQINAHNKMIMALASIAYWFDWEGSDGGGGSR